jgi:hypothetical protein
MIEATSTDIAAELPAVADPVVLAVVQVKPV